MFEKFKELLHKEGKLPKHIAIVTSGKTIWAQKNNTPIGAAYDKSFSIINEIMEEQNSLNIPIISFYLLSTDLKNQEQFSILIDKLADFFNTLNDDPKIKARNIKISILGKWYDLPGRLVESIKKVIDATKDHDSFFVNFCLNYDGQEEIMDAVKLLARQINAHKVDPEALTKDMIKENLASSYFLPPELMIINGPRKETTGLFLWDSSNTQMFNTNKLFPDFTKGDLGNAIKEFRKFNQE